MPWFHWVIHFAKTCFRLVCLQRRPLYPPAGDCLCQSEDLYCTRSEVRNRLPGDYHCPIPQQCGRVYICQATNKWVKKWRTQMSAQRHLTKCYYKSLTQDIISNFELIPDILLQCLVFSPYRVPAGCHQSTSDTGRLLLSVSGLESTFFSHPGLQTNIWTTRSGTHISVFLF